MKLAWKSWTEIKKHDSLVGIIHISMCEFIEHLLWTRHYLIQDANYLFFWAGGRREHWPNRQEVLILNFYRFIWWIWQIHLSWASLPGLRFLHLQNKGDYFCIKTKTKTCTDIRVHTHNTVKENRRKAINILTVVISRCLAFLLLAS